MSDRPTRLDDALRLLREDDDVAAPPELRARVEAKLDALIGVSAPVVLAASAGASVVGSTTPAAKLVGAISFQSGIVKIVAASLVFGAGIGSGVVIDRMVGEPPPPASAPMPPSEVVPRGAPPWPPLLPPVAPSEAPEAPSSSAPQVTQRPAAPTASEKPPAGKDAALRRERALLEGARAALLRDDPATAARLLDEHARTFPDGRLGEEREALRRRLPR